MEKINVIGIKGLEKIYEELKKLFATKKDTTMTGNATVDGNKVYHTGNITVSTIAPTTTMPEGHIHQVY